MASANSTRWYRHTPRPSTRLRIPRRRHPDYDPALAMLAEPLLHRYHPRRAPCGSGRPEKGDRHRGSQRLWPATLVEAGRMAFTDDAQRFIRRARLGCGSRASGAGRSVGDDERGWVCLFVHPVDDYQLLTTNRTSPSGRTVINIVGVGRGSGPGSKRNRASNVARIMCACIIAKFAPTQIRGPAPKGM